jgi:hypothetical protein
MLSREVLFVDLAMYTGGAVDHWETWKSAAADR